MYTYCSPAPFVIARLAQSVEHQTFNLRVKGSSPLSGEGILFMVLLDFLCVLVLQPDWTFSSLRNISIDSTALYREDVLSK